MENHWKNPSIEINQTSIFISLQIIWERFKSLWSDYPKIRGETPKEIAVKILNKNVAGSILHMGGGHFKQMFPTDMAIAPDGIIQIIGIDRFNNWVRYMLDFSIKKGHVASAFTSKSAVNIPYKRVDNLPALVHLIYLLKRKYKNTLLFEKYKKSIHTLLIQYEKKYLNNMNGLVDTQTAGDWMDTIPRNSSTWANLWVLNLLKETKELGLRPINNYALFRKKIVSLCWQKTKKGGYFRDYLGTHELGVDAAVLALYLKLFPEKSDEIVTSLEVNKHLFTSYPMKVANKKYSQVLKLPFLTGLAKDYHSCVWPHLGMMYVIGLLRTKRKKYFNLATSYKKRIDHLIMRYRNIPEVVNTDGTLYYGLIMTPEPGFTMGAAAYVVLENEFKKFGSSTTFF